MKIFQVKDAGTRLSGYEIQRSACGFTSGFGGLAVLSEPFGNTPGPDRCSRGNFMEYALDALFLGRANVRQRPAGLKNLPKRSGSAAFDGELLSKLDRVRRHSVGLFHYQ